MNKTSPLNSGNLQNVHDFSVSEGISEQVTRRLCREGAIPHVRIGGRIYIPREEYNAFITEQCRRSLADSVA